MIDEEGGRVLLCVNFPLGKASLVLSRRHSGPLFKDSHVVFDIGKAAGCRFEELY